MFFLLFSASLKLIQLVVIGLTVVYHHTTHQIYFSLRDMKNMLKRAQKKIGEKFHGKNLLWQKKIY